MTDQRTAGTGRVTGVAITFNGRTVIDDRFGSLVAAEHGTYSGYQAGCRDRCCRDAAATARRGSPSRQGGGSAMSLVELVEAEDLSWHAEAACHPDFKPETMTLVEWVAQWYPDGAQAATGREICNTLCPVREECLEAALARGEQDGTWGGQSERGLRRIRKQRGLPVRRRGPVPDREGAA